MVERVPVNGRLQEWPSNTVRYISRSWRGPVYFQAEGVEFNLRYIARHEHIDSGFYPRHYHPHTELIAVLDGEGVIDTDRAECRNIAARPGDIFVMPPRAIHQTSWKLMKGECWRLLMMDFDLGLDVAGMPLEEGDQVELAFSPFYEWFMAGSEIQLTLDKTAWSRIEPLARSLLGSLDQQEYGQGAELLAGTLRLIAHISRYLRASGQATGQLPIAPGLSRQASLLKARHLMDHRGWFDPGCVGRLAREVGMTESHFVREFHAVYGVTPKQYSQQVLMRRACALLRNSDLPVKDIAERLGYEDPSIFSRAFTRGVGLSPAKFRRQGDG